MRLIVAEKASAARRIAAILGDHRLETSGKTTVCIASDYVVVPLRGHIEDLSFPEEYSSWQRTDLKKLIDAPINYVITERTIKSMLTKYGKKASELVIATDFDVEGESIGREAIKIVKEANPAIKIKRAKFSALTDKEVKDAFANLQEFNYNMADAADARREIDLMWGAVLTRYVSLTSQRMGNSYLSVGRVQTPTLSLITSREREIKAFKPEPYWAIRLLCEKGGKAFDASYCEEKLFDKAKAGRIASLKGDRALVEGVTIKTVKQSPPTPFSTNDFLRAASNLGYSPSRALSIAESLYISGFISYPRTDNTHYPESLNIREIVERLAKSPEYAPYAKKVLSMKKITPTEGKKKTTDHPPIHPVALPANIDAQSRKIYSLIARRFLATLYGPALAETIRADLLFGGEKFVANGNRYLDKSWKEVYIYSSDKENLLPALEKGEYVKANGIVSDAKETKPKPRYSPAALLKAMEDLGLGTKSTRAEIIQKLLSRGYISGRQSFVPSNIAEAVIGMLEKYDRTITEPEMTAQLDQEMEEIGAGEKKKPHVVGHSGEVLHKVIDVLEDNKMQVAGELQDALKEDNTLAKCPKCGGDLKIINTNRGTRFVGCSGYSNGCQNSFPLPAKGRITNLHKPCPQCGTPLIRVQYFKRRPFDMCLDPKCPSKADWGKKKPAEKPAAKKPANKKAKIQKK